MMFARSSHVLRIRGHGTERERPEYHRLGDLYWGDGRIRILKFDKKSDAV